MDSKRTEPKVKFGLREIDAILGVKVREQLVLTAQKEPLIYYLVLISYVLEWIDGVNFEFETARIGLWEYPVLSKRDINALLEKYPWETNTELYNRIIKEAAERLNLPFTMSGGKQDAE